jgi:glycosyltransferase involved in cell wall biosynthesis
MEKKKILMICEAFGGGVFTYVTQLCNDMCEDFNVYLAYAIRLQTPKNYKSHIDKKVHLIEVKSFGDNIMNVINDIKVIKELLQLEKQIKPDLIHLHSSIAGGLGRIAYMTSKIPVIYTPHGYSFILMGNWTIKCKLYEIFERFLGKSNAITLTCCESENEVAKTITRHTAYIDTGVDIADLHATIDQIQPKKLNRFTIYAMGRICIQKQPSIFNEIAKSVPEAHFVWIGNGELEYELTAPNIEKTGWKPRHEAIAMGKGADIYILCSLGEAIAMSLIENLFMGKLCLVSNTMGNKSVIKNGVNGYICDTVDDYVARIKESMINFPRQLAENGTKDVLNHYNTKRMKADYIKFYNHAMTSGN